MNPAALSSYFAAHKPVILGGGAVLVAALGLRARKKSGGAKATAGAAIPGTIPAAAVVGGAGSSTAAYDSTAFDIYDALQQQISDVASAQQTGSPSSGASATPAPIASTLFAPTYDGQYAMTADGQGVEIESDGSLYHINNTAAQQIAASGGKYSQLVDSPGWYSLTGNLQAKQSGGAPQLQHYDKTGALVPYTPPAAPAVAPKS